MQFGLPRIEHAEPSNAATKWKERRRRRKLAKETSKQMLDELKQRTTCAAADLANLQRESGAQRIEFANGARTILSCHGRGQDVVEPRCSHTIAPIEMVESPTDPPSAASSSVHATLNCGDVAVNGLFTPQPTRVTCDRGASYRSIDLI